MNETIYIFADTNLFIQCLPLEQLPWWELGNYNKIEIVVTSPIIREIDSQKNKSNGRVGNKARNANSLFRTALASQNTLKILETNDLSVVMSLRPEYSYSKDSLPILNMLERDDQLISTIYEQAKNMPEKNVVLFTNDTGPMLTAQSLDLKYIAIPTSWLLAPENDNQDKKVNALNAEITRLRKEQPDIQINCAHNECLIDRLNIKRECYPELTEQEITEIMEVIKGRYPFITDYGSKEPSERELPPGNIASFFGFKQVYFPVSDREIVKYKADYEDWLANCECFLKNFHHKMNKKSGALLVRFQLENVGTRPANDALVRIESFGKIKIMPPDPYLNEGDKGEEFNFPPVPYSPVGRWRSNANGFISDETIEAMRNITNAFGSGSSRFDPTMGPLLPRQYRHDDDCFYYKNRPENPCDIFELECKRFRHSNRAEFFDCEIHSPLVTGEAKGCIEFSIQAENLNEKVLFSLPVRIDVSALNTKQKALDMLNGIQYA